MAKPTILKERGTGEELYPRTLASLVHTSTGENVEEAVDEAKFKLFDDQWTAAGGTVIVSGVTYGGLPDGDSFSLVRQLQDSLKDKAIIFLTARDQEEDIIRGLELGAEDYITKPFRNRELLLRVKKALRQPLGLGKKLTIGHFSLDLEAHELMIDGKIIVLTALEYRIMICLMENAGHIVTRERLLDEIYDASGRVVNDNTLSVYIKRLRQKLRPRDNISTIKNLGYRFEVPQDGGEDV